MKPFLILTLSALALASCEDRDTPKEKINDALDRRPAEGLKDAGEEIKDEIKDATN